MAHEIDFSTGSAGMAYVGETPWHGLGQALTPDSPLEVWMREARMDWGIQEAVLNYTHRSTVTVADKKALYRDDTFDHLSIVGADYKVVQPREVLEFFRDLTADHGFSLETAGCLFGGRRFWALARTGSQVRLHGTDRVDGYLLLATACDGTLATTAQFTTVRVVCNNTLGLSLRGGASAGQAVKVRHKAVFRPEEVKATLGLDVFHQFEADAEKLIATPFDRRDKAMVKDFLVSVFKGDPLAELENQPNKRAMVATFESLCNSPGSDMPSARNTAWGALNAVTHYVDFKQPVRGANASDNRFSAGQFGLGAQLKQRAYDYLLQLAA